jgi:hypothetical protein
MTIEVKPNFTHAGTDDPAATAAGMVTPSRWNLGHKITMATARLVGRATANAGDAEELTAAQAKTLLGLTNAALTDAAQTFTKPQRVSFTSHSIGAATLTLDLNANNGFIITQTGNPVIANPSNMGAAIGQEILLVFRGAYQPSFGSYWLFPGDEVPTFSGSLNVIGGTVISATEILAFGGVGMA